MKFLLILLFYFQDTFAFNFQIQNPQYIYKTCVHGINIFSNFCKNFKDYSNLNNFTDLSYEPARDETKLKYNCYCSHPLYQGSLAYCLKTNINSKIHEEKSWKNFTKYCNQLAGFSPTFLYNQALSYGERNLDLENNVGTYAINSSSFLWVYKTVKTFEVQYNLSHIFAKLTIIFWAFIILLGSLINVFKLYFPYVYVYLVSGKYINKIIYGHLIWPACYKKYCACPLILNVNFKFLNKLHILNRFYKSFDWSYDYKIYFPTRFQLFLLLSYYIIIFLFMIVYYPIFKDNAYWPQDRTTQLANYIGVRSGIMAFAQLPLLFLFACRNNIFSLTTGWSFNTFITFHRILARSTWILSIIHAIGYSIQYRSIYKNRFQLSCWNWAFAAIVICSMILILSSRPIRRFSYELFLVSHVIFAAVFIAACWQHTIPFGYHSYLIATISIWAIDKFVRICKLLYNGVPATAYANVFNSTLEKEYFKNEPNSFQSKTKKSDVVVSLTIRSRKSFKYYPKTGAFVFIYFLKFNFWESHPFSVLEVNETDGSLKLLVRKQEGITKKLINYLESKDLNNNYNTKSSTEKFQNFKGIPINVWIEGPYGNNKRFLKVYDEIFLIAGGMGITVTLNHFRELLVMLEKEKINQLNFKKKKIIFLWVCKDIFALNWIDVKCFCDLEKFSSYADISVFIYIKTQNSFIADEKSKNAIFSQENSFSTENSSTYLSLSSEKQLSFNSDKTSISKSTSIKNNISESRKSLYDLAKEKIKKLNSETSSKFLNIIYGSRPDLQFIINSETKNSHKSDSIVLLACGPPAMCDDCRECATSLARRQIGHVEYIEENFKL